MNFPIKFQQKCKKGERGKYSARAKKKGGGTRIKRWDSPKQRRTTLRKGLTRRTSGESRNEKKNEKKKGRGKKNFVAGLTKKKRKSRNKKQKKKTDTALLVNWWGGKTKRTLRDPRSELAVIKGKAIPKAKHRTQAQAEANTPKERILEKGHKPLKRTAGLNW